jgi:hypothetical protein
MLDFIVSQNSAIAALAIVVAILVALQTLFGPAANRRRAQRLTRKSLVLSGPELSGVAFYARSCELRFELSNAGESPAVVRAIRLRVSRTRASGTTRPVEVAAPITVHQNRVELRPDRSEYDVRARTYGPDLPPLTFAPGETEAFVVKLVSNEAYEYEFVVLIDWFSTRDPRNHRQLTSEALTVDFPRADSERQRTTRRDESTG